jgi:hypothetical protein
MSTQTPAADTIWLLTQYKLPPEGVPVETKIDDSDGCRNEQTLKRQGGLWFFPDGTMYVYYTPTHWRPLPEAPR